MSRVTVSDDSDMDGQKSGPIPALLGPVLCGFDNCQNHGLFTGPCLRRSSRYASEKFDDQRAQTQHVAFATVPPVGPIPLIHSPTMSQV
jgi:hypothetical protein